MSEYYPTWGKKRSFHGDIYQLKWLMLFLKRAVDREYSFRLATEMESAAGLDDIVFRYKQDGTIVHRFVQVKHKQDGTEKISVGKLLTKDKNGEFRLAKYFVSYLKIKNNQDFADSNLKDFIVCTNINFDLDQNTVKKVKVKTSGPNEGIEILVDAIDTSDVFFKDSGTRYRFSCTHNNMISVMQPAFKKAVEEAVKELKKEIEELRGKSDQNSKRKLERNQTWQREFERMTNEGKLEDTIKEFFDKLVFAVDQPNESQLEELMKDEISNELARKFKYFGDNEFAYYAFFMMVLGWMKDREGHFLSPKEGREFFQKVELWASTVSEIRQGVERIEEKVDEIGEVLNNQQTRKEPIWFDMRYPVKIFTGRENKLQEIYDKLHENTGKPMTIS